MCSQARAALPPGTLLIPAGFTIKLILETWELSSQETGGHLYMHNPQTKNTFAAKFGPQRKCLNVAFKSAPE